MFEVYRIDKLPEPTLSAEWLPGQCLPTNQQVSSNLQVPASKWLFAEQLLAEWLLAELLLVE